MIEFENQPKTIYRVPFVRSEFAVASKSMQQYISGL